LDALLGVGVDCGFPFVLVDVERDVLRIIASAMRASNLFDDGYVYGPLVALPGNYRSTIIFVPWPSGGGAECIVVGLGTRHPSGDTNGASAESGIEYGITMPWISRGLLQYRRER